MQRLPNRVLLPRPPHLKHPAALPLPVIQILQQFGYPATEDHLDYTKHQYGNAILTGYDSSGAQPMGVITLPEKWSGRKSLSWTAIWVEKSPR